MAMKMCLSFKKEEKDIYNYLMTKLSHSIYIKELILKEMYKPIESFEKFRKPNGNTDF